MSAAADDLERLAELTDAPGATARKRMLLIINPHATSMTPHIRTLVLYALQARYEVDAVDTQMRGHATELCREAADEGYDVVVAFGGDGTVNEAANGLVGRATPLTVLPGGATNVFCRILGIPDDVVDATEHLLAVADDFRPRRVDAGRVNGRHFTFASGIGLDASVVERVDSRPRLKARLGEWFYAYAAVSTFSRRYLVSPPRVRVEVGGRAVEAVTVVVQNADPFTFFGRRPIRVAEGAGLDSGTLSLGVLRRATPLEIPTLAVRLLSSRAGSVQRHRQIEGFSGVERARVTSATGEPFPLQVDGDHIGEFDEAEYGIAPRALAVVS